LSGKEAVPGYFRRIMMKTSRVVLIAAVLAYALSLGAVVSAQEAWEKSAELMYQHGWFLETSDQNFDGGIEVYKKIIERFPDDKKYCAMAQLRIGICLEKLGKKDEARAAYERVAKNYPDQADAVKEAAVRLSGGAPPATKESVEQYKKDVDEYLTSPAPGIGTPRYDTKPAEFAAAYPAEAAEFLHEKLIKLGKSVGPELAKGIQVWKDGSAPRAVNTCLCALAKCGTEKARGYLLEMYKHAGEAEWQFLGTDTAQAVLISFMYLKQELVTDEIVGLVVNSVKNAAINESPQRPGVWTLMLVVVPGNPVVTNGFYELAVFAAGNDKALKYLIGEAESVKDEERACAAIVFLAMVRKAEVVNLYQKIATSDYPEKSRRMAIICAGAMAAPRYAPDSGAVGSAGSSLFNFIRALSMPLANANIEYSVLQSEYPVGVRGKAVYPDKQLSDACVKALRAAFDSNNGVEMRGTVIQAIGLLGREAAKPALIDYAKSAVDAKVREMAVIGLGICFVGFEQDNNVLSALHGLLKDDPCDAVRLQAAFSCTMLASGRRNYPRSYAAPLPRETIPVVLDVLKKYVATGAAADRIALNTTPYDAMNALFSATLHGELLQFTDKQKPTWAAFAKTVEEFEKWWDGNKDKGEAAWAAAGMDEWIQRARDFIAGKQGVPYPLASRETVLLGAIRQLIQSEIGKPPVTGKPAVAEDIQRAQLHMICNWWDKNKDKVTWNPQTRQFETKKGKG